MSKRIIGFVFFMLAIFLVGCVEEVIKYEIKFIDFDDSVIEVFELEEGKTIIAPTAPTREGYEFVGWDKEFLIAKKDLVIKAVYEELLFSVKFIGLNDEVLKEETVKYGDAASAPDVDYSGEFIFLEWDKEFSNVKSDLEVKAKFTEKEYGISFYDGDNLLDLGISKYKKSDTFSLPIPEKVGFEFVGWYLSEISLYEVANINEKLNGEIKLYSRWVQTDKEPFVAPSGALEFVSIKKNPHSSGTGFVYQPEFPAGAKSTSVTAYTWKSSDTKVANISAYSSISIASSGYAIITGTLISDPSYVLYAVIQTSADGVVKATLEEANAPNYVYATFKLDENTEIKKIVTKGGAVIAPTAKEKVGHAFSGWIGENGEDVYNITKDTTFLPTYVKATKSYSGKTVSILGDSITTYAGYIPEGFANFYPYPTAGFGDMNQTWWMRFINYTGMHLLVNNSWSGSAVAGTATSAAQNNSRLEHLYIGDVTPDVIVIFMGANDAPSQWINVSQFDAAYAKMLSNIKERSPESEIILCTLPSLPLFSEQEQADYNAVIRKYANQNSLKILDFDKAFTRGESSNYLVDSAHPNKEGMEKLANKAIMDLYKDILVD
ncbi:MAG: GDSL-type esterase/lipase family protein [Bacilli bacterium]